MTGFIDFYQNLPLHISPIAFQVGFLKVEWYSLMYLLAFLVAYWLLRYRLKKDKRQINIPNLTLEKIETLFFYGIIGAIIGGRLGYVFFYEPGYFLANPWQIISPFDAQGNFAGIYGMSYHGGLIGIFLAAIIFVKYKINPHTKTAKPPHPQSYISVKSSQAQCAHANCRCRGKNKLQSEQVFGIKNNNFGVGVNFWQLADFAVPSVPAGYFFGRISNFLNGELYGRLTDKPWGMHFIDGTLNMPLRHPSQLYEAFFEGLVLFAILWTIRNNKKFEGQLLPLYIIGYSLFRFLIEFFREPDEQVGFFFGWLTIGQILSLLMVIIALIICFFQKKATKKVPDEV